MTPRTPSILLGVLSAALLGQGAMLALLVHDGRSFRAAVLVRLDGLKGIPATADAHALDPSIDTSSDEARLASLMWPSPTLRIVDAGSDLPVAGASVSLTGSAYQGEQSVTLDFKADADGRTTVGPVRPGAYRVHVRSPGGLAWDLPLTVTPGESGERDLKIPPEPVWTAVSLNLSWPPEITSEKAFLVLQLEAARLLVDPNGQLRTEPIPRFRASGPLGKLGRGEAESVWAAVRRDGRVAVVPREILERLQTMLFNPAIDPDDLGLHWGTEVPIRATEYVEGDVAMRYNVPDALVHHGLSVVWMNDGALIASDPKALRVDGELFMRRPGTPMRAVR